MIRPSDIKWDTEQDYENQLNLEIESCDRFLSSWPKFTSEIFFGIGYGNKTLRIYDDKIKHRLQSELEQYYRKLGWKVKAWGEQPGFSLKFTRPNNSTHYNKISPRDGL